MKYFNERLSDREKICICVGYAIGALTFMISWVIYNLAPF